MILNIPIEITSGEKLFLMDFFENRNARFNPMMWRLSKVEVTGKMEVLKDYESLQEKGIFIIEQPTGNVKLSSTGLKVVDLIDRDKRLEEILK